MVDEQSSPISDGWFPDPSSPGMLRYWDGYRWTEHTAELAADNVEQVAGQGGTGDPYTIVEPMAWAPPDVAEATGESSSGLPSQPRRRHRLLSIGVAAALVAAAVAGGLAWYFTRAPEPPLSAGGTLQSTDGAKQSADTRDEGASAEPTLTPQEARALVDPSLVAAPSYDVDFLGDPVDVGDVTVTALSVDEAALPGAVQVKMHSNWYEGLITTRPWSVTGPGWGTGAPEDWERGIGGVEHIRPGENLQSWMQFAGPSMVLPIVQVHYADVDGGRATWFAREDALGEPLVVEASSKVLYHAGQRVRAGGVTLALLDREGEGIDVQICSIDYEGTYSTAPWSMLTTGGTVVSPTDLSAAGGHSFSGTIRPGECFSGSIVFGLMPDQQGDWDTLIYDNGEMGPYHWDVSSTVEVQYWPQYEIMARQFPPFQGDLGCEGSWSHSSGEYDLMLNTGGDALLRTGGAVGGTGRWTSLYGQCLVDMDGIVVTEGPAGGPIVIENDGPDGPIYDRDTLTLYR